MIDTTATTAIPQRRFRIVANQAARIRELTQQIIRHAMPTPKELERRREPRIPYPHLLELLPLDDQQQQIIAPPLHVVGHNLSTLGLDFYHQQPIEQRFVILRLPLAPECHADLLMRIHWCRFRRAGWYDSGGKFVKQIAWLDELT